MVAEAQVEEIKFPTILNPGEDIIGEIVIKNVGDETSGTEETGHLSVIITTMWNGKEHPQFLYGSIPPGETHTFSYYYSVGKMPDEDAELKVVGRTWFGWDIGYRPDDVKTWIITTTEAPPLQDPLVEGLKIGIPISTGFAWTTFLYTGNIQTAGLVAVAGLIIPAAIKLAGKTSPSEPPEESDAFNFLY